MLNPAAFEKRRSLNRRLVVFRVVLVIAFALLAAGFWLLQVVQSARYRDIAENQHIRAIPLRAPRGVLFDRDGRVLVENKDSFTIAIVREQSPNANHSVDEALHTLALATGIDEGRARDEVRRRVLRRDPLFRPIPIIEHATFEQVAAVTARRLELPEVVIQQVPTRAYPADALAAHLFGYVNEIQEAQLDRPEFAGLLAGAIVGQSGVERTYNARLMGRDGKLDVIVNSKGREIDKIRQEDPIGGERLQLTIDSDLQRALESGLRANGFAAAGVFLDPHTGEILALSSVPSYDPNDFANGMDRARLTQLNRDPQKPFQNRIIQGLYSPGSTFKILMAIAALSEGVITPDTKFYCNGHATFYGREFACDRREGHGWLDLRHAIEQSCNVYFYNVGNLLKIDTIREYAERLGLAGKTGVDLPGEIESIVPSTQWKLKTSGQRWYPGETISVSIGQGQVTVTPLALATMMATVANGGTVVIPHVLRAVDDGHGWQRVGNGEPRSLFPIRPDVLGPVHDGLWLAVNGEGTASRARLQGRDVAGKTGTAQVISKEGAVAAAGRTTADLRDNSWFVFFAPRDNPQIAGVVFAEHAGHGGLSAAPIARFVLETFFAKRDGRPLPVLPPLSASGQ